MLVHPHTVAPPHRPVSMRVTATQHVTCTATESKVVGVGSCGIDYLAAVAAFPRPDEKLRTQQLELQGGGNAANALTAAARLGLQPALIAVIGDDSMGDAIIQELACDGVDTIHVLRPSNTSSPFTYIIVDQTGGTRTCIHTPGPPYPEHDVTPERMAAILKDAVLLYSDGRHTPAATRMAQAARSVCGSIIDCTLLVAMQYLLRAAGVPVLVEAESLRPGLDGLLLEADFVVASTNFPSAWTGESGLGYASAAMLQRLPRAQWLIVTLGKRGALCMHRAADGCSNDAAPVDAEEAVSEMLDMLQVAPPPDHRVPDCITASGLEIRAGAVVGGDEPKKLVRSVDAAAREAAASRAQEAAARAALARADGGNEAMYQGGGDQEAEELLVRLSAVAAADLQQAYVVDTTGAGDAFIGSIVYGLANGLPLAQAMQLGTVVAACKCTALGPRPGLPTVEQLSKSILDGPHPSPLVG